MGKLQKLPLSAARPAIAHLQLRPFILHPLSFILRYSLLAVILSWPLPLHFTTHVPGSPTWAFDESTFLWNMWYFRHALLDLHSSPLHTSLIFYPLGIDLVVYTYHFYNDLVALPLQMVLGLPAIANLLYLASTTLSAYGTFLLAIYLLRNELRGYPQVRLMAAGTAGLVFAFASNRAIYAALGHYNFSSTQWVPFFALYLCKTLDVPKVGNGLLAGLFLTLALLCDMTYGLFLAMLALILLLVAFAQRQAAGQSAGRWLGRTMTALALMGLTTVVLWGPVLIPVLREFSQNYDLPGWGEGIKLSADLMGLLTPSPLHPIWGATNWPALLRAVTEGTSRFSDVNTVFLGFVTLALAVIGWRAFRRQSSAWAWAALVFGFLCLGPFLQINGSYRFDIDGIPATIPLPFALLHYLPIAKANRTPNRNSIVLMLSLAMLVGYALAWALPRLARLRKPAGRILPGLVSGLIAVAILFEHLSAPLPLSDARIPDVYAQIAAEPGDFSILQLPLGWRNSFATWGPEQTLLEYYQSAHGKPMLGGNTSRNPPFKFEYFQRLPLFDALVKVQSSNEPGQQPSAEEAAAAKAQGAELAYLYNLRYVLMLPPIPGRKPYEDTWQNAQQAIRNWLPLEAQPVYNRDGIQLYRVVQPAGQSNFTLVLSDTHSLPYLGDGWAIPETLFNRQATWATATEAHLFIPLRLTGASGDYRLRLTVHPFTYPGGAEQRLAVQVNGVPVETPRSLTDDWSTLDFIVPAAAVRDGLNDVTLNFNYAASPRQALGGNRAIGQTGTSSPLDIELHSADDFAFMTVENPPDPQKPLDISAGRRGYNVAVLDQASGRLLEKRGFDTFANAFEAERLAEYLDGIPAGRIVAIATRGDAGQSLTDQAVTALRSVGTSQDLRSQPGASQVILGVKGAAPGSAAEALGKDAYLRVGLNADRRTLAAAVERVMLEPKP